MLCIGALEWLVGLGVFVKSQLARWVGVIVVSLNAIAQLLMIPAYPFWSLTVFALNMFAIYGLVALRSTDQAEPDHHPVVGAGRWGRAEAAQRILSR